MFAGDSLAGRKRLVWAGLAFGIAGAVKIWAIFPLAVALGCCVPRFRRRTAALLFGAVAGFATTSWPFFLLAPTNFVRDTIVLQLGRAPSPGSVSSGGRLLNMTGLVGLPSLDATVDLALILAVVYVTDEDDCSAPPTSDLFDPSTNGVNMYGTLHSFRCTQFGVQCNGMPVPPMSVSGLTGCQSQTMANGGKLFDIQKYTDFFTKPAAQGGVKVDPNDVILVGITSPADPVASRKSGQAGRATNHGPGGPREVREAGRPGRPQPCADPSRRGR